MGFVVIISDPHGDISLYEHAVVDYLPLNWFSSYHCLMMAAMILSLMMG